MKRVKETLIIPVALLFVFCLWYFLLIFDGSAVPSQMNALAFGIVACIVPFALTLAKCGNYIGRTTVWAVTYGFVVLELCSSIVIILLAPSEWQIPLFVQVIVLIAYIATLLMLNRADAATDASQYKGQFDRRLHQGWANQLKPLIVDRTIPQNSRNDIESAYDALRSTPTKSIVATSAIDDSLTLEVQSLILSAQQHDYARVEQSSRRIKQLAQERKIMLSSNN